MKKKTTETKMKTTTALSVKPVEGRITDHDIYFFKEGNHFRLYNKLGSHLIEQNGVKGAAFAVWAPNAEKVSVIGDFNDWDPSTHRLAARGDWSGIWEGFIPDIQEGSVYKYSILSRYNDHKAEKADPFAFSAEVPPKTASIVTAACYEWTDHEWMRSRKERNSQKAPISIYEVHFGSWRRVPEEGDRPLTYREMAPLLTEHVRETGFTHVEFLPLMEHPFYGSWGYQTTGYFAPTARYGSASDLMYLIDYLHNNGIGVILDWVPSHFPADGHGLSYFDGTHLFEHADARQGFHPDWASSIFNYGRNEVRSFLISSAIYWLDRFHIDGIRVDAVASMLYLDYSRKPGEWLPNEFGGRENIEAINFIKKLNEAIYQEFPDVETFAEESTAWPMVSRPTYVGGLGFGSKWNMGWMHDTLKYFSKDPVYRKYSHNQLTFSIWYAFTENFLLPLSHDEVVHGKGSLIGKMPGDEWQKFANLRVMFGYMFGHPGKKLLFMGNEFGQIKEWNHDESIEWHCLLSHFHSGLQKWVSDLNRLYRAERSLYELDSDPEGFEWIDFHDAENSTLSFVRKTRDSKELMLVVCNLTPIYRPCYRIGVPRGGWWQEMLNSDGCEYSGSGKGNSGGLEAEAVASHKRVFSLNLILPPLSIMFFKSAW